MQPQGEVTNVVLSEANQMLIQAMNNQVGQQRRARQEKDDILRIPEFLRMNPPVSLVQALLRIPKILLRS